MGFKRKHEGEILFPEKLFYLTCLCNSWDCGSHERGLGLHPFMSTAEDQRLGWQGAEPLQTNGVRSLWWLDLSAFMQRHQEQLKQT